MDDLRSLQRVEAASHLWVSTGSACRTVSARGWFTRCRSVATTQRRHQPLSSHANHGVPASRCLRVGSQKSGPPGGDAGPGRPPGPSHHPRGVPNPPARSAPSSSVGRTGAIGSTTVGASSRLADIACCCTARLPAVRSLLSGARRPEGGPTMGEHVPLGADEVIETSGSPLRIREQARRGRIRSKIGRAHV